MKSAPGPSTIELGSNPSVIEPSLPRLATLNEPFAGPAPLGGPSTISGKSDCPASCPGPGVNDTTEVAKRDVQLWSTLGAGSSEPAEPHAEEKNPSKRRAPNARPHKLTKM